MVGKSVGLRRMVWRGYIVEPDSRSTLLLLLYVSDGSGLVLQVPDGPDGCIWTLVSMSSEKSGKLNTWEKA